MTDNHHDREGQTADSDHRYPEIHPKRYYDDLHEDEWERLNSGAKARLEFENTVDYLESHLPDKGHILDAGGAAGRYAIWLAERGYNVTLTDISNAQLDLARKKVAEHGVAEQVTVKYGDIRDLPFDERRFDAVCCLGGPLSHVIDPAERQCAVRELSRVATVDAPVFVSVMGFIAVVERMMQVAPEFEQGVRQLPDLLDSQTYSADLLAATDVEDPTFVECHFFRADELRQLLSKNGFSVVAIAGLEGVASNFEQPLEDASDEALTYIREIVRERSFREDPTVADMSNHILAVVYATEDSQP
ncbi:class I SAM-dependent methyltransferase [Haladaptatus halobius]|uniref:class I SAM-dependent methyltransferase n=1 Tax=Haladaptatus halobius TaxID=2884875 RepID=UPI001D0AC080|nr:class I SAM-dependent methyltransferase [Haladaptatus halobius]